MDTSKLFTPLQIGKKQVTNRFIYQPTETNCCDEKGAPTGETLEIYRQRAAGWPRNPFCRIY